MKLFSCLLTLFLVACVSIPALAESDVLCDVSKFLACDEEKGGLLKVVTSISKEKEALEQAVQDLKGQLDAQEKKLVSGEAEVADIKELLKVAQEEGKALKAQADAAEEQIQETKQLYSGAQEESGLLQAQITRLYDDLKERQQNLEEASAARDKLDAELKATQSQGDESRRDLEAKLEQATKAATSERSGLQVERDMLRLELDRLTASLREAELAYLPMWSHGYYEYARQTAEPALKYHREEIMTGKAYAKAKVVARDTYVKAHAAAHPHAAKAWEAIEPHWNKASEFIQLYWGKLQEKLQEEPYRTWVKKAEGVLRKVYSFALNACAQAIELWNSDEANKAKAFGVSQKQAFERDLAIMYTHALGADVPGSGFDASFVQSLVQATMFAVPALLLAIPFLCMCRWKKGTSAPIPTASPAVSKSGKRGKKK